MAAIVTSSLVEKSRSIVPVVPSAVPNAFCIRTVSVNVFASNVEAIPPVGKPVQFVSVPLVGVPRIGVTSVGLVLKTRRLLPVSSETNVATCADVEDVIPVIGSPVHDVKVPLLGVPRTGVVKVLFVSVSVPANVAKVPVVGKVTLVAALEVNVIEFVAEVIRVEPVVKVKVPVPLVMVFPL